MKKIIITLSLFIIFPTNVYSQIYFSNPVKITGGNNDRNPSFGTNRISTQMYEWEFMVFERTESNSSSICVTKIGDSGAFGGDYYITNDSYNNINPSIAYSGNNFFNVQRINYAVIVWQSDKFGRQSIFMSTYNISAGWTTPIVMDSSGKDNVTPRVCSIDSINFSIVYKSGSDIMYKKYNVSTNKFSNESNITLNVNENCFNPHVKYFRDFFLIPKIWISYEKEISANRRGIYFTSAHVDSTPLPGGVNDTIAVAGHNRNLGFGNNSIKHFVIFESDRSNNNVNIYGTSVWNHVQTPLITDSIYDVLNYSGGDFAITDNPGIDNYICSYILRSVSGKRLIAKYNLGGEYSVSHRISSNPDFLSSISMNNSIRVGNSSCERHWFVYNKDSLNPSYPSTIYGFYFTNCLSDLNSSVIYNPGNFYLSQNYPNPFNPTTRINYELRIKNYEFISMKIFDALGREVAVLVNQKQNAGRYEVEFNARHSARQGINLPSGIYFYSLSVDGKIVDTKRMLLLK